MAQFARADPETNKKMSAAMPTVLLSAQTLPLGTTKGMCRLQCRRRSFYHLFFYISA
jgi:hypothetical protein